MTCELERSRLRQYLEGKLPDGEAAGVEAHLETCASCQSVPLLSPEFVRLLRAKLPAPVAAAAMRARLQQALDAALPGASAAVATTPPAWRRRLGTVWMPRLAIAALLFFLLLVPARTLFRAPAIAQELAQRHDAHAPLCGGELPACCRDLQLLPGGALAAPSEGATVPDLEPAGLELLVSSRCEAGMPANLLCYRSRSGEYFSLYITDQVTEQFLHQPGLGGRHRVLDHDVVVWERHGLVHCWVGPHSHRKDTDRALALLRPE